MGPITAKQSLYIRDAVLAFTRMIGQATHYLSDQFTRTVGITGGTIRSSQLLNTPLYKSIAGQSLIIVLYVSGNIFSESIRVAKSSDFL